MSGMVASRRIPSNGRRSQGSNSPELGADGAPLFGLGHYAGCKWTEPPAPSALPQPPTHWTQTMGVHHKVTTTTTPTAAVVMQGQPPMHDIESRLKVLLKVQA